MAVGDWLGSKSSIKMAVYQPDAAAVPIVAMAVVTYNKLRLI